MSNRPGSSRPPERRQLTRRQIASQQHEANVQRRVVLALSGAVGLALLLIIAGFVFDRFVAPNQTLRQVNSAKLTRAGYDDLTRTNLVQQMSRLLQFSKLFGSNQSLGQGGRLDQQVVDANTQLATIGTAAARTTPVDESVISTWVDQQVTEQQAAAQFQINPNQGEIDQLLVSELGSVLQSADTVTDTAAVTETVTASTAASPAASAAASADASAAASADASAAASAAPTALPTATPLPAEATTKADQIVDVLYTEYTNILGALPEEAAARTKTAHASKADLATALRAEYRARLLEQRVGEALVKEVPAGDTSTPTEISARHILLQVPKPTPTPTAAPEATETAVADAMATAEPVPTPTLTPAELEGQFAERKTEADGIYQQLIAKPETFPDVARALSDDPGSKEQGGDVGTFNEQGQTQGGQTLVPEFVAAAFALKENEISQPVRTQFGWHIIQRLPEDPEAKLTRLRTDAYTKWLAEQRAKATIIPAPTPTPTEIPPVETEVPAGSAAPEATTTP